MSAFNILTAELQCYNCKVFYNSRIQFKFGDTWQIEYKIGDKIKWGGNDIGRPGLKEVKVYGILESNNCPSCNYEILQNEYDIFIENDIIKKVELLSDINDYLIDEEGNYRIYKE